MYTIGDLTWYMDERRRESDQYAAHLLLVQQAAQASKQHRSVLRLSWLERLLELFLVPAADHLKHPVGTHL